MKKSGKNVLAVISAAVLVAGTAVMTVLCSGYLISGLNQIADKAYARVVEMQGSPAGENPPSGSSPEDPFYVDDSQQVDDNSGNVQPETSADDSVPAGNSDGGDSSQEDVTSSASDTTVEAADSVAVTYPYYIGTEFVIVDPEGNMVYIVKKGDTLSFISGIVGYSVDELAEYNEISNVNLIYTDESIRIPAGEDLIQSVKEYLEKIGDTEGID